jgi:hypothetical protein
LVTRRMREGRRKEGSEGSFFQKREEPKKALFL